MGEHSILHETPVTWRENGSRVEEEIGHMVSVEEAKEKKDRVKRQKKKPLFIASKLFLNLKSGWGQNVVYCYRN